MNKKNNKIIYIFVFLVIISSLFNTTYATQTNTLNQNATSTSTQTTNSTNTTSNNTTASIDNTLSTESTTTKSTPEILSKSAILMDASTGQILYEYNADTQAYPASTTKLMTAILTLENCELTDIVEVDANALSGIPKSYTTASLQAGEKLTVDQLLHVLLIPSANDAANVLAFHIAGSLENFSVMMNAKAKELGCKNTNFVNPSGIHDDNHYSTAYDMALIGKYANTFEEIQEIACTTTYSLPNLPDGRERTFKTTNTLITPTSKYYYEYATGLKTGYTDKAKSCIVAKAKKDDMELICVVLGGEKTTANESQRELDCHSLFDYGFNNYSYEQICSKNESVDISDISNTPEIFQDKNIVYSDDLKILSDSTSENIEKNITWNTETQLPIQKDTVVGTVIYNLDNNTYTMNLIAGEDILPYSSTGLSSIYYILLTILLILLILMIFKRKRKNRFHRKSRSSKEPKYFKHSFY